VYGTRTSVPYGRFSPERLREFVEEVYTAIGSPTENAAVLARSLVKADFRGHNSYDVHLIPHYYDSIQAGDIDLEATPSIAEQDSNSAVFDHGDCIGRILSAKATDTAIDLAMDTGMATVTVKDANHLGQIGEWARGSRRRGRAVHGLHEGLCFLRRSAGF